MQILKDQHELENITHIGSYSDLRFRLAKSKKGVPCSVPTIHSENRWFHDKLLDFLGISISRLFISRAPLYMLAKGIRRAYTATAIINRCGYLKKFGSDFFEPQIPRSRGASLSHFRGPWIRMFKLFLS